MEDCLAGCLKDHPGNIYNHGFRAHMVVDQRHEQLGIKVHRGM